MKKFLKTYLVFLIILLALSYVGASIYGSSWDPTKWTDPAGWNPGELKEGFVGILVTDFVLAFFITAFFDED
jgi:hypothetical protein